MNPESLINQKGAYGYACLSSPSWLEFLEYIW